MALAEARAAWQRTANRCLVQEDAKRAPKLACCPSVTPACVKQTEKEPTNAAADNYGQDNIAVTTDSDLPSNSRRSPSYSNLSPNSRWWLQTQPNYGWYQKVLMDQQLITSSMEGQNETSQDPLNLEFKENVREKIRDVGVVSCQVSKSANDVYFDSESSWINGAERNTPCPWWRTADNEELAFLVAQRSVDVLENCDLPTPQNTHHHVNKDMSMNIGCYFSHDEISTSLLVRKPGHHVCSHDYTQGSSSAGNSCWELRKSSEDQLMRDSPTNEKMPKMHGLKGGSSRAQLLEALCHSQTRAREAEEVMKQACAEKEHVVKLVLRQASQIFAYKQWVQLLQLENNTYFQLKNSKSHQSAASINAAYSPIILPNRKSWRNRKRGTRARRPRCDVAGKYAFVFALGLGLVGAGLLLGWTIGWMLPLPTW